MDIAEKESGRLLGIDHVNIAVLYNKGRVVANWVAMNLVLKRICSALCNATVERQS